MQPFIYTKHVNIRIEQRNISKTEIEQTILEPDKTMPAFKGRSIAQKDFRGQTLEVVFKRTDKGILIITAYWLKDLS